MSTKRTTEEMISRLSEDMQAIRTLSFSRVVAEWFAVVVVNIVLTMQFYGLRADFNERMIEPLYVAEMALNIFLIVIVGALATACAYPDRARCVLLRLSMLIGLLGYSALIAFVALRDATGFQQVWAELHAGWYCTGCILHFALVPAVYVTLRLRKLACTKPLFMGFCVLMLAGLTGTLGVRLVMPELATPELLAFHYVPLLVISAIGLIIGKCAFKW